MRLAKIFAVFLISISVLCGAAAAYLVPDDTIVYVTPTGSKYHRENCSYCTTVSEMTISDAEAQGYTPCSRCDPDVLDGSYSSNWDGEGRGGTGSRRETEPVEIIPPVESKQELQWPDVMKVVAALLVFTPAGWVLLFGLIDAYGNFRKKRKQPPPLPVKEAKKLDGKRNSAKRIPERSAANAQETTQAAKRDKANPNGV